MIHPSSVFKIWQACRYSSMDHLLCDLRSQKPFLCDAMEMIVACCAPTNAPSGVKDTPQIGHEGEEKHLILEPFDYNVGNYAKEITPQKGQLGTVIRSIKSAVTHWANQQQIPFKWQRNFYDHIIRSSHELMATISYIEQNPANWEEDLYNV